MLRRPIRLLLVLALLGAGALLAGIAWLGLPGAIAGFAARTVCSGVFVAGRSSEDVLAHDVLPASALLRLASVTVDASRKTVRGRMPAARERVAVHVGRLGCVLDPTAELFARAGQDVAPDVPGAAAGPALFAQAATPAALTALLDEEFRNEGDDAGRNARAVVVLRDGRLVAERYAPGFDAGTPQVGWSMTKTVLGFLVHARLVEQRQPPSMHALDWVPPQRRPAWLRWPRCAASG